MTNFDRYLARKMRSRTFRLRYRLASAYLTVYLWLWRVTHRREARREVVAHGPIHDSYIYPFVGHRAGRRVTERLTRYVGER